ncbi:hypothetical protein [Deinococcus planocerae]|uniref:hypothetical protein n=1 Tax=Deinococcus planocerae TaxID=1737569 RepID=UPI000C7F5F06|nr:hypothetical protein [Deinococcus planocerae]
MKTFEAKALQLAYHLTEPNTYEGKVGQGYVEARAADIRRTYNILCGLDPEHRPATMPTRKTPLKRKTPDLTASAEV